MERRLALIFTHAGAKEVVRYGSCCLIAAGIMGLLGWILRSPAPLQLWPGMPFFTIDSAFCFLISGLGLLGAAKEMRSSDIAGATLVVAGGLFFVFALGGANLSIHHWLPNLTAAIVPPSAVKGYGVAGGTGLVFLFLGSLILTLGYRAPGRASLRISAALAIGVMAVGFLSLLSLLTGTTDDRLLIQFLGKMSVPAAACACVAGVVACGLFWLKSHSNVQQLPTTLVMLASLCLLLLFGCFDSAILSQSQILQQTGSNISLVSQRIATLQELVESVRQLETYQRNFVLNGDQASLAKFSPALQKVKSNLAAINFIDNPSERISRLRRLIAECIEISSHAVAINDSHGHADAVELVRLGQSVALMDSIHAETDIVRANLQQDLSQRLSANRQSLRFMQRVVVLACFLALLLTGFAAHLVRSEMNRRADREAAERERLLETTVVARTGQLERQTRLLQEEITRREQTEGALYASEDRLRSALEFAKSTVWTWSVTEDQVEWSGPVTNVFGHEANQLATYSALRELIHPDDRKVMDVLLSHAARERRDYTTEFRIVLPSGSIRWIAGMGGSILDETDQSVRVAGVFYNITQRKAAEQRLEASERRFRELAEAMPQIVWTANGLGKIDYYNSLWYRVTGLPSSVPPGEEDRRYVIHPDDYGRWAGLWRNAIACGAPYEIEYRFMDVREQQYRWYLGRAVPIHGPNGQIVRWFGTCTDIHERKTAELLLQESERQLRLQADAMPTIVWTAKVDGTIEYYNRRWYEYTALSYEETKGWGWKSVLDPDKFQESLEAFKGGLASQSAFEMEIRLKRGSDQTYRWHLLRSTPLFDHEGNLIRWFGTSTDIHEQKTEQERLEAQVQSRTEALRRLVTEKETLLKEVHHRVKNNLQVISSLLRMQAGSVKDRAAIEALTESQHRLLSLSMIHERLYGDQQVDEIDFSEYCRTLVDGLFRSYAGVAPKVVSSLQVSHLLLNIDQAIPCGLILNELVTNALKYAYPNGMEGEIAVELKKAASGTVTLGVSDQGVGLPAGFDWQNSSSMGLPIVDLLVKQLGGSVTVRFGPGTGFLIEFPAARRKEATASAA